MKTVADLRTRLVAMGIDEKEVKKIKGKANLVDKIKEREESYKGGTPTGPASADPLQLILASLDGIKSSVADLTDRVKAVESNDFEVVKEHVVIEKVQQNEHLTGVTTMRQETDADRNFGHKQQWNKNGKKDNTWEDDMADCKDQTIDAINARNANVPGHQPLEHKALRQGNRPEAQKIEVRCFMCNRIDLISQSLAPHQTARGEASNYRCNACAGSR